MSASAASAAASKTPLDLEAAVASVIAPYATDDLNAALYSYGVGCEHLELEATFHHDRTRHQAEVRMALFGSVFVNHSENSEQAMRTRAWPFTRRQPMIDVLAERDGLVCPCDGVNLLVFWKGAAFLPPAKLKATEDLRGYPNDYMLPTAAAYFVELSFVEARTPISHVLSVDIDDDAADASTVAAAAVDKVLLLLVGNEAWGRKKAVEEEAGGKKRSRK